MEVLWPLLGTHAPYHQRLCEVTGSIKSGLMLSLSVHWTRLEISAGCDGWLARTAVQWSDDTGLSVKEQATVRARLRELELIQERRVGQPARLEHRVMPTRLGQCLSTHLRRAVSNVDWLDDASLAELLGPSLSFHRMLMRSCGGVHAGLLMSRVLHQMRSQIQRGQSGWVRSEASRWQAQIGLTRREQESARAQFERLGIWQERLAGHPARVYVQARLDVLAELLRSAVSTASPHPSQAASMHKTANQDCGKTTFLIGRNVETRLAKKVKLNKGIEYIEYSSLNP
jgi:hypothetical protein